MPLEQERRDLLQRLLHARLAGLPTRAAGGVPHLTAGRSCAPACATRRRRLQCKGVLPLEKMADGSKPPQKWGHYQNWWQTIMTVAAPELRGMGWSNLK